MHTCIIIDELAKLVNALGNFNDESHIVDAIPLTIIVSTSFAVIWHFGLPAVRKPAVMSIIAKND